MKNTKTNKSNESNDSIVPDVDNPGTEFNPEWIDDIRVNLSAVKRRTSTLTARRTVKKEWQAAWLVKAISCIDLTTLSGQDTPGKVRRLCAKARTPVSLEIQKELGIHDLNLTTGAVCVYHEMVPTAVKALKGSNIPVAAVSTGFPAGLSSMEIRIQEIKSSVAAGAREIDIVITRAHVLNGNWQALYDEVKAFKKACGKAHMKSIIATGELSTLNNVAKASMVSMMAGSDFIKTSTGMEPINATLHVSLTMIRMIRAYQDLTGFRVGFKPAGGIGTAKDALSYLVLIKEELGDSWLHPNMFRFGASSLLGDIERQLEHYVTGRYSANHRHAMS
ncbi:MAG: deoxyribose-phosphate aldolase [Kangiella sp.]|nr:MAG: deoxyribose-phosphate aldolase [Kangiella sp.]